MSFSLYWVKAEWSSPYTEWALNYLYFILSVRRMILTFRGYTPNDLYLVLSVRRMIFINSSRRSAPNISQGIPYYKRNHIQFCLVMSGKGIQILHKNGMFKQQINRSPRRRPLPNIWHRPEALPFSLFTTFTGIVQPEKRGSKMFSIELSQLLTKSLLLFR
jgi:hypothetical protein